MWNFANVTSKNFNFIFQQLHFASSSTFSNLILSSLPFSPCPFFTGGIVMGNNIFRPGSAVNVSILNITLSNSISTALFTFSPERKKSFHVNDLRGLEIIFFCYLLPRLFQCMEHRTFQPDSWLVLYSQPLSNPSPVCFHTIRYQDFHSRHEPSTARSNFVPPRRIAHWWYQI